MAVILINYDLNKEPPSERPSIPDFIKENFKGYVKLSESSYAVQTDLSAKDIYKQLKPLIDSDDELHVITLSRPYEGYSPDSPFVTAKEWLDSCLEQQTDTPD